MIYSPLEQFNILSIYDFSLLNLSNFEYIEAKFLLWFWFFFSGTFSTIDPVSTFFIKLAPFINAIIFSIAQIIMDTNLVCIAYLSDILYSFYYHWVSISWYVLYQDLSVLYQTGSLFFLRFCSLLQGVFLWDSVMGIQQVPTPGNAQPSIFLNANINLLITDNILYTLLTNFYFFILEITLIIYTWFYSFFIQPLFSLTTKDFSFLIFSLNTSTLWLFIGFSFFSFLLSTIFSKNNVSFISNNNWQTLVESLYGTVLNVVSENAGIKNVKYFPLIFTTFLIILMCNLLGMIPYSFTVTSHLIVTFSAALAIFAGMNIIGILKHGKHFLSLFFPPGAPLSLALLLVIIEFISYVFRVFSLSIRLFANLMSGHTLLKILSTFAWVTVSFWGIFLIPLVIIFLITGLELMIACLQAYIFVVLLSLYIHDAINLH